MIKNFTAENLSALSTKAQSAERLRSHLNVHDSLDSNVQRLFIATEPNTYMRPHLHPQEHKWEFFILLEGMIDLFIFNEDGSVKQRTRMSPQDTRAVEVPAGTWHCYLCMKSGTLALEVKEGAYTPKADEFASWSPAEGAEGVKEYMEWLESHPVTTDSIN